MSQERPSEEQRASAGERRNLEARAKVGGPEIFEMARAARLEVELALLQRNRNLGDGPTDHQIHDLWRLNSEVARIRAAARDRMTLNPGAAVAQGDSGAASDALVNPTPVTAVDAGSGPQNPAPGAT